MCIRDRYIDYLEKGVTITGEYYSNLLSKLEKKICEKRSSLQKKKLIFQCTCAQKCFGHGKIKRYLLCIVGTFSLIPRFGSLRLPSFVETHSLSGWAAFFIGSRSDFSCRGVFCRRYRKPLQERDSGIIRSLE